MNYGYEGTLLLPVPVTVPADFTAETLERASCAPSGWSARTCAFPKKASSRSTCRRRPPPPAHAALFAAARAALPQPVPGARATAAVEDGALVVRVAGLPPDWHGQGAALSSPRRRASSTTPRSRQASWQGGDLDGPRAAGPAAQRLARPRCRRCWRPTGSRPGLLVQVAVTTPWPARGGAAGAATARRRGAVAAGHPPRRRPPSAWRWRCCSRWSAACCST